LLKENEVPFEYREYRRDPLSVREIRDLLAMLDAAPRELLRTRDRAFKELGLTGGEEDDRLIELMAEHPTLLQRPIGVHRGRAVVGRPPARLLELLDEIDATSTSEEPT
jgi:arsenate reductase